MMTSLQYYKFSRQYDTLTYTQQPQAKRKKRKTNHEVHFVLRQKGEIARIEYSEFNITQKRFLSNNKLVTYTFYMYSTYIYIYGYFRFQKTEIPLIISIVFFISHTFSDFTRIQS